MFLGCRLLKRNLVIHYTISSILYPLRCHILILDHFNGQDSGTDSLEVPTVFSGLFFREYPQKIWPNIWYVYVPPFSHPGFCLRWFFIFQIGNPPFEGIYSEYFLFFGDPLGKSKHPEIPIDHDLGKFHHDLTSRSNPGFLLFFAGEIIPFYGRTVQRLVT